MTGISGKIERIWDVYPYTSKTSEIDIILADITAVTMATASPDKNNVKFYKDSEAPLLWYYTQCSIAEQRDVIVNVILPHAYKTLGMRHIRILWIPKSGVPATQVFERDVLEVADGYQKAKTFAQDHGIVIEMAMAKSWLPLGLAWHEDALKIARMNHALDALCYHWLTCRCVDLTSLTMHDMEGIPRRTAVHIQGLENQYLVEAEYRWPKDGGHDLGWFGGRKGREIARKVMQKYRLEPDFEKVRHSSDRHMRVEIPRVFWDGRKRDIPEPERGIVKPSDTFRDRRQSRRMFAAGTTTSNKLTDTYLGKYLWYVLNVQSTIPGRTETPMAKFTLSPSNEILTETIEIVSEEQVVSSRDEKPVSRGVYKGGISAKRGRPGSEREGRRGEPHLSLTRVIREHESEIIKARETSASSSQVKANRSLNDEEPMLLEPWDVPPAAGSPGSSTAESSSSSDSEDGEKAIQALVEKVAATMRAEFLRDKEEKKKRKRLERELKEKRN